MVPFPARDRDFLKHVHPDWLCDPASFLSVGYQWSFSQVGKVLPGDDTDYSFPSSTEVRNE